MAEEAQYITCVCTANVCRSPMAEALLRHALAAEDEPLRSLKVVSAGVNAWEGCESTENAVRALKKVGIELSNHSSQPLSVELLDKSLLVICMTESHRLAIRRGHPALKAPVVLMRELMMPPAEPEVPDPYGADLQTYEATRDALVEAVPSIIQYLKTLMGVDPQE